jgi:hypothetical protein
MMDARIVQEESAIEHGDRTGHLQIVEFNAAMTNCEAAACDRGGRLESKDGITLHEELVDYKVGGLGILKYDFENIVGCILVQQRRKG